MITRYLTLVALRGAVRLAGRLIRVAVIAAALLAAAPVSLVAGYSAALAWLLGWPPRRLYAAALWCLPMVAVWLAWTGLRAPSGGALAAVATAPYHAWLSMWHLAAAGSRGRRGGHHRPGRHPARPARRRPGLVATGSTRCRPEPAG